MAPLFTAHWFGFGRNPAVEEAVPPISVTGGTKTTDGSNYRHTFTSSGTLVISNNPGTVPFGFVVAGGGGGGGSSPTNGAGGGGAGGYVTGATTSLTNGTYTVTVGAAGQANSNDSGGPGGTSFLGPPSPGSGSPGPPNGITALGGGGGGAQNTPGDNVKGQAGGCSGGASYAAQGGPATQPGVTQGMPGLSPVTNVGYTGGTCNHGGNAQGAGGGGASGNASDVPSTAPHKCTAGSAAVASPHYPGTPICGGGGSDGYEEHCSGGGGAGDGGSNTAKNASDNRGGGGGGCAPGGPSGGPSAGGHGGSGVVVITYPQAA